MYWWLKKYSFNICPFNFLKGISKRSLLPEKIVQPTNLAFEKPDNRNLNCFSGIISTTYEAGLSCKPLSESISISKSLLK